MRSVDEPSTPAPPASPPSGGATAVVLVLVAAAVLLAAHWSQWQRGAPAAGAVLARATPAPAARIAAGQALFVGSGCPDCHRPDARREAPGIPPLLDVAGSKLRRGWLLAFLDHPQPMRYARENERPILSMPTPNLDGSQIERVADYLLARTDPRRVPVTARYGGAPDPGRIEVGAALFQQYQCRGCHTLHGEGGRLGPDLTRAGARLKPDYIEAFLRDPQALVPGTPMRRFDFWDDELVALVEFLRAQE